MSNITESTQFIAAKKTLCVKNEWVCKSVPCIIISQNTDGTTTIKPFNKSTKFTLPTKMISNEFISLTRDDKFVYVSEYPDGKIALTEFNIQQISIDPLKKQFKDDKNMLKILTKLKDAYNSKGNNSCIKCDVYTKYNSSDKKNSKLERIGDPIFNRSTRHSPPVPSAYTRENFEECSSFPAPIGIRREDFALPSEQNEILKELITQIFSCEGAPECPIGLKEHFDLTIIPNSHVCNWCGEIMNLSDIDQSYCSKQHSVNFCHRDPVIGTKKNNVYWGHCSCNREQGGFSEKQRLQHGLRLATHLAKNNPELCKLAEGLKTLVEGLK